MVACSPLINNVNKLSVQQISVNENIYSNAGFCSAADGLRAVYQDLCSDTPHIPEKWAIISTSRVNIQ